MFFKRLKKNFLFFGSSYNSNLTPIRCINSASRLFGANQVNDALITSIEEIYSKKWLGEYWVAGQNVGVESVVDWYYISCKNNSCSCKRKVTENGGMMYCGSCKSSWHEGVVRYKVLVRVADESGDVPMLIWDRECEESVGLLAGDLKAKYRDRNKSISPEFGCLRGMSMLFQFVFL
nr:replication protein A 70 kDa DNA-binding subunit B-like [Ipomoea batatas]